MEDQKPNRDLSNPLQSIRDVQHFGEEGGVVPVIDVAATSTFLDPADMERTFQGEMQGCYLYSRHSNPTVTAFGKKLAAMEGAEAAIGVASGMSAISCTLDQIFRNDALEKGRVGLSQAGGHIVSSNTVYGGTYALFKNVFPSRGISVDFVDATQLTQIEKAIRPDTRVIYVETLSNPLLSVCDLRSIAALAKKKKILLVVDNTFAPLMVRPLELGADIVIHSCTKFISGSSDFIAGAIASNNEFVSSLIDVNHGSVMLNGPVMDPRIAHELYLRLDHLPIRMQAHSKMALFLSERMSKLGVPVLYPGLKSHPQYELFQSQSSKHYGAGGVLTLDCGTSEKARILATRLQDLKFGLYAVSLGFSRTLMSCSAKSTSSEIPEEEQKQIGLLPGLLRMSIGYTGDPEIMAQRFEKCWKSI